MLVEEEDFVLAYFLWKKKNHLIQLYTCRLTTILNYVHVEKIF